MSVAKFQQKYTRDAQALSDALADIMDGENVIAGVWVVLHDDDGLSFQSFGRMNKDLNWMLDRIKHEIIRDV